MPKINPTRLPNSIGYFMNDLIKLGGLAFFGKLKQDLQAGECLRLVAKYGTETEIKEFNELYNRIEQRYRTAQN